MRITYVGYGDFHRFAGMKQLYHFAQEVCRQGHEAQILIAGSAETVASMEEPPQAEIVNMAFIGPLLARRVRKRVLAFGPNILHVWTPRHVPALAAWQLWRRTGATVILDHEDDEDYHLDLQCREFAVRRLTRSRRLLAPLARLRNAHWHWVRPLREDGSAFRMAVEPVTFRLVTQAAQAHTAISPGLAAWVQDRWPKLPVHLLYPGADLDLFSPNAPAADLKAELGLDGCQVLVYSGAANLEIYRWFLTVLASVRTQHPATALVLVGDDGFRAEADPMTRAMGLQDHCQLVGQVPYERVPHYLSLGDVLLQHPLDLGNRLRLPAKLPEYLGMGKAVVTYAEGIGQSLQDNMHVRKLYTRAPEEAARVVCELLDDPGQRARLGCAARGLAGQRFDWSENTRGLVDFYRAVLSHQDR